MTRREWLKRTGTALASASMVGGIGMAAVARPDFANLRLGVSISAANAEQAASEATWATKAGFGRVQLNVWGGALTDQQVAALCAPITGAGLKIVALGCYINPLDPANLSYMGASVDLMRSLAGNHRAHGARTFVTWSGGYHDRFAGSDPRNASPEAFEALVEATGELLAVLEPCRGRIAFEPFFPDVLGTVDRFAEMFRRMPTSRVGLVMDPPNFVRPEDYLRRSEIMGRAFERLGPRVLVAHLKDIGRNPDGSVTYPAPCEGEMNYAAYLTCLASLGRPVECILEHTGGEHMGHSRERVLRALDEAQARA
ncbi:MAG TPA: sugar phosphate isomerase/epimerase [Armatimonadota bacterium]|nr:sugar phosphate isomerase/epimerase [Armatimonadota bacterium]HQK92101.1 sugar phosphate isomerase/epimerase [Armatimonadota bacterium]